MLHAEPAVEQPHELHRALSADKAYGAPHCFIWSFQLACQPLELKPAHGESSQTFRVSSSGLLRPKCH